MVGALNRCRCLLPLFIKRLIYKALFHAHLNYCALIWGNTTLTNLNKLKILQKRAIRAIENIPYLEHTRHLFIKHKIVMANDIYKCRLLQSYISANRGKLDTFLTLANLEHTQSIYFHRYKPRWKTPFSRTIYGTQRLSHTLPSILNAYEQQDIEIKTLNPTNVISLFL